MLRGRRGTDRFTTLRVKPAESRPSEPGEVREGSRARPLPGIYCHFKRLAGARLAFYACALGPRAESHLAQSGVLTEPSSGERKRNTPMGFPRGLLKGAAGAFDAAISALKGWAGRAAAEGGGAEGAERWELHLEKQARGRILHTASILTTPPPKKNPGKLAERGKG